MKTLFYEILFLCSLVAGAAVVLVSCEALQRAGEIAVTPQPELDNKSPVEVVIENVPKVVENPANPFPWLHIGGAVVTIVLGFFGVKKVRAMRAAAVETSE